ncbi:MAG TPA: hypothetical protein VE650_14570 [Acetobacteraceae bacterium]|jgi:hypothetical protein|nr:hypothetical protein [Acetobacteraceae bacterium]
MSDNPLEMTPERQAWVRARAEELWRADGSPAGRLDDYMERADELVRMELAGPAGLEPNPVTRNEPIPGVVVEEAEIQDNLGEFPAAANLDDEGRWRETPMTREQVRKGDYVPPEKGEAP